MQIFLDTAEPDLVRPYAKLGIVDGITTNPTLIAKSGRELKPTIIELCKLVKGPVSAEVVHEDYAGMLRDANEYVTWHKNVCVKVPMTENGLALVRTLRKRKIPTNVTLVFRVSQALLASKCGATYISPFVGRLDDVKQDGMALIAELVQMKRNYGFDTKILVASVRSVEHIEQAAHLGADICTVPPSLIPAMLQHSLTDKGLKLFGNDWKNGGVDRN